MNLERIYSMKRQNAFTLAEVLITLGIIGVVAAMTMPSLLNATQGKQYVTAYKRALATMSQAGAMNYALEDSDFSTEPAYDILKKRMNVVKDDSTNKKLYFNDGTSISLNGVTGCTDPTTIGDYSTGKAACKVVLDVNGDKKPNVSGKDRFTVLFTRQGVMPADASGERIIKEDKLLDANQ